MLFHKLSETALGQNKNLQWIEEGNLEWGFSKINGTLVIKGKGPPENYADGSKTFEMKDFDYSGDNKKPPWKMKYEEQIKSVVICNGVISIGEHAFCDRNILRRVSIPKNLEYPSNAFLRRAIIRKH